MRPKHAASFGRGGRDGSGTGGGAQVEKAMATPVKNDYNEG